MFICIVCLQISLEQWKVIYLPVIEKRQYSAREWEEQLIQEKTILQKMYVSENSVTLYELDQLVGQLQSNYTSKQIHALMRKYAHKLCFKWIKIMLRGNPVQQNEKQTYALEVWQRAKPIMEGRLLHLYELQKSLQHNDMQLTLEQLTQCLVIWAWQNKIELQLGIKIRQSSRLLFSLISPIMSCRRCSNTQLEQEKYKCHSCGQFCLSCADCAQLGKVRSCTILIKTKGNECNAVLKSKPIDIVNIINQYNLSAAQTEAVHQLLNEIIRHYGGKQKKAMTDVRTVQSTNLNYILWAVTGAGKTEMIFPLIHLFLIYKLKILIAIPRRDVVQELEPRISKAFEQCKVVALYGGSEQIWESGDIYIATTHQIIRFDQYFDLVILDEMDAFPYYNNATLKRTLKRIQNRQACFIQLTATIPAKEKFKMMLGQQKHVKVPVRYHQKPLPIPQYERISALVSIIESKRLPESLCNIIVQSYERGAVLFIFLQRKVLLKPFTAMLCKQFPHMFIDCTSAEDEQREYKVKQFRERKLNVLVTTSILERGVTIKKSDICILDVHQKAYNRTAIVQMAGRAGRSIEDPNGHVYLLGVHKTKQINAAINEIKAMNRLAKRKGYLKED